MSELDETALNSTLQRLAPQGRTALLPALQAAQKVYGYLPEAAVTAVARALRVPLADVYGVVEFYTLFYTHPVGRQMIRVCTDPACALAGAEAEVARYCDRHGLSAEGTTVDGAVTVERVPCLGLCEHAPAVLVNDSVADQPGGPVSRVAGDLRLLTRRCGLGHRVDLAEYGPYAGLARARTLAPDAVIAEVKAAGLVGRGGAAFPTGVKWEGAAQAAGQPKYVICNADESEPGTFKDRVLLLDDPHSMLEGLCIAAYAIGATQGYIYVRGEYPYVVPALEAALQEARTAGYVGAGFEVEVRVGAGAYICGEETALFESIEGKRGFPRIKPPFPVTHGLFQKPTVINNVETLCNVPLILREGAAAYRQLGTAKSPGPKVFCVSGDVARPGVYEVPFGVTIRHLLDELAGGVTGGGLQAILFGGAAGAFATVRDLDVRLSFEDLRAAGLPLGSGVVMVFNDQRDLRDTLQRLGHFFAHESCGKCYPCQLGTQRQYEILTRVAAGRAQPGDRERLQDVGWTMTDASLCGLGQTAAAAVLSAIKLWPALFAPAAAADE